MGRPKGTIISVEQRAKQSAAMLGRPKTAEHRAAISAGRLGMKFSVEHRQHISEVNRARSPETRDKLSAAAMGNTRARSATVKGECVYCGGPATEREHPDPQDREWIVLACRRCNASKNNRTPLEWLEAGLYVQAFTQSTHRDE